MKLYSAPISMYGAKTEIAILEKNIPCEVEFVSFGLRKGYDPKHPEVNRINPKKQVPVLIDGDLELYDSTQILEYLEDAYPEPRMWPENIPDRARARQLEHEADEVFFSFVQTTYKYYATPEAEEVLRAKSSARDYFYKINTHLADREYLVGTYSYADLSLMCAYYFGAYNGVEMPADCINFDLWRNRIAARPAVRTVLLKARAYLISKGLIPSEFIKE